MGDKKEVGRPTKYKKEYCKRLRGFFNQVPYQESEDSNGKAVFKNIKIPTVQAFAIEIGVNRDTIYEWAKKDQEFSDTLKNCNAIQEQLLFECLCAGAMSPSAAIFALKARHGYKDNNPIIRSPIDYSGCKDNVDRMDRINELMASGQIPICDGLSLIEGLRKAQIEGMDALGDKLESLLSKNDGG